MTVDTDAYEVDPVTPPDRSARERGTEMLEMCRGGCLGSGGSLRGGHRRPTRLYLRNYLLGRRIIGQGGVRDRNGSAGRGRRHQASTTGKA